MGSRRIASMLLLAVAGCSGGGDGGGGGPECDPLPDETLTTIQSQVFGLSCDLATCHDAVAPAGPGLDLSSSSASRANLVSVPAEQQFDGAPMLLVDTAGGAEASYLYKKITDADGIEGVMMPQTGQALCQEKIDAIAAWIDAGAPDD